MKALFFRLISFIMAIYSIVCSWLFPAKPKGDFEISLDSNPTTGYSWDCSIEDKTVVSLIGKEYISDSNPQGLLGKGGVERFCFDVLKPGTTRIIFTYQRSWENGDPIETVVYTVRVDENEHAEYVREAQD